MKDDDFDRATSRRTPGASGDAVSMLLSAAIFGLFGFFVLSGRQQFAMYALLVWTLRGAAVGFLICALGVLVAPRPATVLYLVVSAVASALFLVAGVWILTATGGRDLNGFLALIFGLWNGSAVYRQIADGLRPRGGERW